MATATAEKTAADTTELVLLLATEGEMTLADVQARFDEATLAIAWARGEIEFGQTKHVVTGNPTFAVTVHNGVKLPPPTLVVEGGVEWSGPKQRWHAPYHRLKNDTAVPVAARYQKYQLEVCVNKEKDVWEWLEEGKPADGRETRFARRDINRAEAESMFALHVRLTDKGAAGLTN